VGIGEEGMAGPVPPGRRVARDGAGHPVKPRQAVSVRSLFLRARCAQKPQCAPDSRTIGILEVTCRAFAGILEKADVGAHAMTTYLPPEVQAGLDKARKRALSRRHRLRVEAGARSYRVLRAWDGGFALDAARAPQLRGLVDLYDGARHLRQCLIVACEEEGGELRFDLKRVTEAEADQPLDYPRGPDAPVALIGRD
jgi:hypothetical protein